MKNKSKILSKLGSLASFVLFNLLWILILVINKPYLDSMFSSRVTVSLYLVILFTFFITDVVFLVSKQREYLNDKLLYFNIILALLLIIQYII